MSGTVPPLGAQRVPGHGASSAPREGQTIAGTGRFVRYANFVKLPHTVFVLPFALVGVTLASYSAPVSVARVAWVVLAFTAARFAAMGFNRIVDAQIDARNPRTAMRELPAGAMSLAEAWGAVLLAVAVFEFATTRLNGICLVLSPLAVTWVFFYSYTKRFTRWSHLVLGLGLGIAPVGGFLAISGRWSDPWWMLLALAGAVMCWTAGFDVFYALQDIEFDRANDLFSLPAKLGARSSLIVARVLHAATVALLAAVGIATRAGKLYGAGVLVAAALLAYENSIVRAEDISRVGRAFFTINMALSSVFLAFVLAERLFR